MTDENRLFQLYQIFENLQDGQYSGESDGRRYGVEYEEFYMPIGESGEREEFDKAKVIRLAKAIIEIARDDEDFEDDLPSIDEVFEALQKGPAIAVKVGENLKAFISDWETRFPECHTAGEVEEAMRLAGPRLQ